jgi:hypothetical protein
MVAISATVENVTSNKARELVLDLEKHIKRELSRADEEVRTDFERSDDDAMDMGTILTIILAGPAVVALANAVRDWVKFNSGVDLSINGVTVNNLNSEDVAEVIKAINAE